MKVAFAISCLAIAAEAAYHPNLYIHMRQRNTQAIHGTSKPREASVPGYKFTIPVDHFDLSNNDTFTNRYFVNDTFYRKGGPVIFFDHGEAALDASAVDKVLAETRWPSLPMQLAAKIGAIVIGWEHRYYGYSRPVPINDASGFPKDGIKGYKYHTVEQALEDIAYFANRFNGTELDKNRIVRNGTDLGPNYTPWIFVGGSYSGSRAAWMRMNHPEVIYAAWASSAPLQYQADGSGYFNPILRSMPQNCTDDITAAIGYLDNALASGPEDVRTLVKIAAYLLYEKDAPEDKEYLEKITEFQAAKLFARTFSLDYAYQSFGTTNTSEMVCDFMQAFDVNKYDEEMSDAKSVRTKGKAIMNNPGGKKPKASGLSAGEKGPEHSLVGLVYGTLKAREKLNKLIESVSETDKSDSLHAAQDYKSWEWQVISQLGVFQGSNPENITAVSKYYNFTAVEDIQIKGQLFGQFDASDIPKTVNNKPILNLGAWDIEVSNVMFTNGEFDPWRAFGVASQENGAPNRRIVQNVPDCNKAPPDKNIFGLIYPGAVHVEDVFSLDFSSAARVHGNTPQEQGIDLFMQAWGDSWADCFYKERDKGQDETGGDGSSGGKTSGDDGSKTGGDNKSSASGMKPFDCTILVIIVAVLL